MIHALTPRAMRSARIGRLVGALAVVILFAACGGKSEAQLANDALNAGIAAHTAGNIDEAKKQYTECLKHDATNKVCHYDLGLIAQTAGDPTTAENEYRLSLSADPNYTPAIFNLAILRAGLNDTTEAIALYRRYVAILPNDAGGHLNLGLLLIASGDRTNGDKEIAMAVKLDPTISIPKSSPAPTQSVPPSEAPTTSPKASPSK